MSLDGSDTVTLNSEGKLSTGGRVIIGATNECSEDVSFNGWEWDK